MNPGKSITNFSYFASITYYQRQRNRVVEGFMPGYGTVSEALSEPIGCGEKQNANEDEESKLSIKNWAYTYNSAEGVNTERTIRTSSVKSLVVKSQISQTIFFPLLQFLQNLQLRSSSSFDIAKDYFQDVFNSGKL